jgi:hypothetical protein
METNLRFSKHRVQRWLEERSFQPRPVNVKRTSDILHRFRSRLAMPDHVGLARELMAEKAMLTAENGLYSEALPLLTHCDSADPKSRSPEARLYAAKGKGGFGTVVL